MTAALILAAGAGRRMGGPKALLVLDGETLLRRTVRRALEAGCAPVFAVVGDWANGLEGLAVQTILNLDADEGMARSIRLGVRALPAETASVLILTVDQPEVDASLLRRLIQLAEGDPGQPAACSYQGTLGIPAVLPRRLFADLLALRGDRGAKAILMRQNTLPLPFPGGAVDLDTPEDLDRLRR